MTVAAAAIEASEPAGTIASVHIATWVGIPHGLVSLLDLMKQAAISEVISALRNLWTSGSMADTTGIDKGKRQSLLSATRGYLAELDNLCLALDLPVSRLHIKDLFLAIDVLQSGIVPSDVTDVVDRGCAILSSNLQKEMSLKMYFTLPHDKAEVFDKGDFGADVSDAFPSAGFDISESCKCYALGRNTGCVFHLMRVMEIGLGILAKRFGLPCDHTNWDTIINRTEKAIGDIDKDPSRPANWKDEREFYSQCASHFRIVKDAWRNYSAHARGKYDEQEALDMLGNVRGFMQKLVTRLHE
jgi:hypothetical protein